jgi:hypothetical protein
VAVPGIGGAAGSEKFYKIDVPAGQAKLEIMTSGGTGDVDLYVRKGAKHRRGLRLSSVSGRSSRAVTIDNPDATYFIMPTQLSS